MLGELTNEIRMLYEGLRLQGQVGGWEAYLTIADAWRDAHAAKLKAEFWREHDESVNVAIEPYVYCQECGNTRQAQLDPRHEYDDPAWQEAAHRELTTP